MPSEDEYRYCARLGMTQSETAGHLGVSRAAVTKAKQRLSLTFAKRRTAPAFWPETVRREGYGLNYGFDDFEVGDCVRATGPAAQIAWQANRRLAPKRFVSANINGIGYIARAA